MTEQNRKKIVYLVFVAAVIYGVVNFLGSRPGNTVSSTQQAASATVQPMGSEGTKIAATADTLEWKRDPFARSGKSATTKKPRESLRLSAISGSAKKPLAVINGKVVGSGEVILGWKVVNIDGSSVKLQRDGESRILTFGGS